MLSRSVKAAELQRRVTKERLERVVRPSKRARRADYETGTISSFLSLIGSRLLAAVASLLASAARCARKRADELSALSASLVSFQSCIMRKKATQQVYRAVSFY